MPTASLPTGGDTSSYRTVIGPHVTEKASMDAAMGKYVFRVHRDSNKVQIRASIEKLYKVTVKSVHVAVMPTKQRQVGRHMGTRSEYKKAIVTLKKGDKIDIIG